jgi:hypothetical protein
MELSLADYRADRECITGNSEDLDALRILAPKIRILTDGERPSIPD